MQIAWWGGVAVFALALYFAFYPGIANGDTFWIISEGLSGNFTDWHSPAASLFAVLAAPLGMPEGFLIVQVALAVGCACYLGALALGSMSKHSLTLSVVIATVTAYTILLIVLASSQAIKDMWIVLLLASAGLLLYRSENPAAAISATCLCAIAVLVRPISIFPAAPLVAVAVSLLTRSFTMAAGASLLALALIAILPQAFVAATNAVDTKPEAPLFIYDIIGIAVQTPDPPDFVRDRIGVSFTDQQLQNCYDSKTVEPFMWKDCKIEPQSYPKMETWLQTIREYPFEYLKHRFSYYPELLARIDVPKDGWVDRAMFPQQAANSPKWVGISTLPPMEISMTGDSDNAILNTLLRLQRFVTSAGIGSPYVWTAVAFAAIALAWSYSRTFRSRRFLVVTAISLSSVANTISFMLFSAHAGARYLGWSLVGAALAMALASLSLAKNRTGTVADQDPLRA